MKKSVKGFTLIELLLVIGIIAILAVAVFVALNPAKRFADARDARRESAVETILSALHQYNIDQKGVFPTDFPLLSHQEMMIGTGTDGCTENPTSTGTCNSVDSSCINLQRDWLPTYLKTIPVDPQKGSEANTHYDVVLDTNGMITVKACEAEGAIIQASR